MPTETRCRCRVLAETGDVNLLASPSQAVLSVRGDAGGARVVLSRDQLLALHRKIGLLLEATAP